MAEDRFGYSVAVDGDTVVVGAYRHDLVSKSNAGAAYVFAKPDDGWAKGTETVKLTASDGAEFDYFGYSVAVDSKTIVVGAHQHELTNGPDNAGAAYVFTKPDDGWATGTETAMLTADDPKANAQFGSSVSVDGDTVVVGAPKYDGDSGAAYVFTEGAGWATGTGTETARLAASDREKGDYFGTSVSVRGDTIVVGAYAADIVPPDGDDDNPRSGAAYVFTKPGHGWANYPNEGHRTESTKLILPRGQGKEEEDQFGHSVALDGQYIVVGAPLDDVDADADDFGSVYVSDIPVWTDIGESESTTTSATVTGLSAGVEYTFQVRAVDEAGSSPPSNIVHATPTRGSSAGGTEPPPNYGPSFVSGNNLTPAVDENAPPGTLVGSPITATDPEGDNLIYLLQGTDASSFGIVAENGQLMVNASLDYESKFKYQLTVRVNDGENSSVVVDVTITVNNVDEIGTISLSSQQAKVGTALTAEVSDPDGSVTGVTWQWASSPDLVNWQNIAGATSTTYTPVAQDMDRFLRVTVSYADGEGPGKQEQFNFGTAVQGLPVPMATPAPEPVERDERPTPGPRSTPEPTAAPTVKPTRVAERPAVPRPEAMARPTPETSGIPMPETGAIFVPEPTLLPTPALAPVGTPVQAQDPTAIPTPTTAPAPATPQVAPDDEGGVNGWLITLLAGGAVAIAAGTFFVVWIRG